MIPQKPAGEAGSEPSTPKIESKIKEGRIFCQSSESAGTKSFTCNTFLDKNSHFASSRRASEHNEIRRMRFECPVYSEKAAQDREPM